jgi:phospholipid/cholesterol/gamma-HCH transport system substrate-binding protein
MENQARYVAVGAFVLVMLAVLFTAALWLAGTQLRTGYQYYRLFVTGSVTGLNKNATVRLNGIAIGKVDSINLDPVNPNRVIVILAIREGTVLHRDAVASVSTAGLTGQAYVLITGGTLDSPVLTQTEGSGFPIIQTRPSALQQVEARAPDVLARVSTLANRLETILTEENSKALSRTIQNLAAVSDELAAHRQDVGVILDNAAATSKALPQTIADIQKTLAEFRTLATPARGTLADARAASQKLEKLADDLDRIAKQNQSEVHDFASTGLPQLTALSQEMRDLVANLSRLSAGLSQDPSALLYGDRRKGYTPPP